MNQSGRCRAHSLAAGVEEKHRSDGGCERQRDRGDGAVRAAAAASPAARATSTRLQRSEIDRDALRERCPPPARSACRDWASVTAGPPTGDDGVAALFVLMPLPARKKCARDHSENACVREGCVGGRPQGVTGQAAAAARTADIADAPSSTARRRCRRLQTRRSPSRAQIPGPAG